MTKLNLGGVFHILSGYALRWNLSDRNPIALVRQSRGRRTIPRILTGRDIKLVLEQPVEPDRTMVLVAACLGLRAREVVGLQWRAISYWDSLSVLIRRGVVNSRSADTKTEASQKALPVDARLPRVFWSFAIKAPIPDCKTGSAPIPLGSLDLAETFCSGTLNQRQCEPA
jgi:integrase